MDESGSFHMTRLIACLLVAYDHWQCLRKLLRILLPSRNNLAVSIPVPFVDPVARVMGSVCDIALAETSIEIGR